MRTEAAMLDQRAAWGITLLRVGIGFVFFMHGLQKLSGGVAGMSGFFGSLGVPAPDLAAVVVLLLETVGAIALVLGLFTRPLALLFVVEMLVAGVTVHLPRGFFVGDGGYELVFVLGLVALTLAITGPGALALDHALGIERRMARLRTA